MKLAKTGGTVSMLACGLLVGATWAQPAPPADSKTRSVPPATAERSDDTLQKRLAAAQATPKQTSAAIRQGAQVASFCANCHGQQGNSTHADTPNLAGQHPSYLLDQMLKFADGQRQHEFMQRLIRAMSADEKVGVALYYANQPVTGAGASAGASPALLAQGKSYYGQVCFRCHGADGRGNESHARLAGQQSSYVARTLRRYRDGSSIRQDRLMADSTRLMSDQQIDAVAAYVAAMR